MAIGGGPTPATRPGASMLVDHVAARSTGGTAPAPAPGPAPAPAPAPAGGQSCVSAPDGLCLDAAGGSTALGTPVRLVACSTDRAQQLVLSGAGTLDQGWARR